MKDLMLPWLQITELEQLDFERFSVELLLTPSFKAGTGNWQKGYGSP